jgi:hypothetical protein
MIAAKTFFFRPHVLIKHNYCKVFTDADEMRGDRPDSGPIHAAPLAAAVPR